MLRLSGWLLGRLWAHVADILVGFEGFFAGWRQPGGEEGKVEWDEGQVLPIWSRGVSLFGRDCAECEGDSVRRVARADASAVADVLGQ